MSDDLLRRMEKTVRRFGGPMAIDDLLPELDAESSVLVSNLCDHPAADSVPEEPGRDHEDSPVAGGEPGGDPEID